MVQMQLVRMYSILPSKKKPLFEKSAKNKLKILLFIIMEKSNSGMQGHGMPIEGRAIEHKPLERNGKEMPTKGVTTTTIHESKHFPFQIIEINTSDSEDKLLSKIYKVGAMGAFMSEKTFTRKCDAEKYISSRPWELITNLICLTIQNAISYEKSKS